MAAADFFSNLEGAVKANGPQLVQQIKGIIRFDIKDAGVWTLNLKSGNGSLAKTSDGPADITISVSEADFLALVNKKLNPQQAFMKGKIKVKGNMGLAMKLTTVIDAASKTNNAAASSAKAAVATAAPKAGTSSSGGSALKSAAVFQAIGEGLKTQGATLVKKVNGVIVFEVSPGGAWTLDLKNGNGSLTEGKKAADLTITVADNDFFAISQGKLNAQQAFMKGKLKAKGNMGLAMKLGPIFDAAKPKAKL